MTARTTRSPVPSPGHSQPACSAAPFTLTRVHVSSLDRSYQRQRHQHAWVLTPFYFFRGCPNDHNVLPINPEWIICQRRDQVRRLVREPTSSVCIHPGHWSYALFRARARIETRRLPTGHGAHPAFSRPVPPPKLPCEPPADDCVSVDEWRLQTKRWRWQRGSAC